MTETLSGGWSTGPATEADWTLCPGCRVLVYGRKLGRNLGVCPNCGRHAPLTAPARITQLFDPGSVEPLGSAAPATDPLDFVDTMSYADRLDAARRRTGLDEAVVCVRGTVAGHRLVAAVMDFRFMGGSLGCAVGELITQAAEHALGERIPLLVVSASGGARMQEGALSLMQMAKTSQAIGRLDEAGVLTISLVTDPTYGGVAASYTTLCDVIIAEPGARLGFAGPRVIRQTIGGTLPADFQTAEFLLANGMVDAVVARSALRRTLAALLAFGTPAAGAWPPGPPDALVRDPDQLQDGDPWDTVRCARDPDRPTTTDYLSSIVDSFEELHGDRLGGDCPAVVGGVAMLDGHPLVVVGHQKGHDAAELTARRFGMATPAGHRKAARLMRLAAKIGVSVLTLIDTPGAYPGAEAEAGGQAVAIAENLRLMAGLPVPVVAVITGEGGSGGALALGVANRVLICANAVYSVISPEGCAAILWKDPSAAPVAASRLGLRARDLLRAHIVDAVVPEPLGGTQRSPRMAAELLRAGLTCALGELAGLDPAGLAADRRARFRRFGADLPARKGEGGA